MIKELVLHLGDTKTGSTSIQQALVHKVCQAPGVSILYPTQTNHVAMAKTLTQKRRFEQRAKRFGRVMQSLKSSNADLAVVSAEHFQFVDPVVLQEAIEAYWPEIKDRIRLVAYVRPHAEKLLSSFAERVKLGVSLGSLEEFFEKGAAERVFLYAPRFDTWRGVFGDRFELRPFIRSRLYQGDVIHDFFRYLLGSEAFEITKNVSANTSLTVSQLALLREAQIILNDKIAGRKAPRFTEARSAMGRLLAEYMRMGDLGQDGAKLRIPATMTDRIQERYAADAKALDAAFFDGTPMFEALEAMDRSTVEAPQSLEAADYFSSDAVSSVRAFSHVLGDLLIADPENARAAVGDARSRLGLVG